MNFQHYLNISLFYKIITGKVDFWRFSTPKKTKISTFGPIHGGPSRGDVACKLPHGVLFVLFYTKLSLFVLIFYMKMSLLSSFLIKNCPYFLKGQPQFCVGPLPMGQPMERPMGQRKLKKKELLISKFSKSTNSAPPSVTHRTK